MTEKHDLFHKALVALALHSLEMKALEGAYKGGGKLPDTYAGIVVAQMVEAVENGS
jgi:hypothetical protein